MGTYWGVVSTPCTAEVVDSAGATLVVGPLFNDYNTVAFSALINDGAVSLPVSVLRDFPFLFTDASIQVECVHASKST